jgi:hypothetical protein
MSGVKMSRGILPEPGLAIHGSYNKNQMITAEKMKNLISVNNFKNIIDFGAWNGWSAILAASAIKSTIESPQDRKENYLFDFSNPDLEKHQRDLVEGKKIVIEDPYYGESLGHIKIYDLTWGDTSDKRSDKQSGNIENLIQNIQDSDSLFGIKYTLQKYDYFDWLEKSSDVFDFMHVDISFIDANHFNSSLKKISEKIDDNTIIAFHHNDNMRFKERPQIFGQSTKGYEDILENFIGFDMTDPGFCTFSNSSISEDGKIL